MTIEEMQRRKREFGYSNEKLAELSGVPLGTVQKVMSGSTKSPRQGTLEALARALSGQKEVPTQYPGEMIDGCIRVLREPWGAYAAKKEEYTIEDIYALPEGVRAELIDGEIYYMATPTRTHQKIVGEMYLAVAGFVRSHGGACEVYIPPYAVYLNADNSTRGGAGLGCRGRIPFLETNGLFAQAFQIPHSRRARILDHQSGKESRFSLQLERQTRVGGHVFLWG